MVISIRISFLLLSSTILFSLSGFSQKHRGYKEFTVSPFNITARYGSNDRPNYWIYGKMNSVMIKFGTNTTHVFRVGFTGYNIFDGKVKSTRITKNNVFESVSGAELRMGYQYIFKNNNRKTVPFISSDFVISSVSEYYNRHIKTVA